VAVSLFTSRGATNESFFSANKNSKWYLVAFGMIGTSLSGVTFISVPGQVGATQWSYLQLVFGYLAGYLVVGGVLMPLYYRLNLISIYAYLEQRLGVASYKTGAFFFLLSRSIGSAARFYLVINVLQFAVFQPLGVPFTVTVILAIALIWLYTFKGGMKTIIWTDTLQSFFMLLSVGISIFLIADSLGQSLPNLLETVNKSSYSKIFFFDDYNSKDFFFKQFFSGMFITIVMTGLDQDLMQKNLTCKNIGEAQKNMFWFSLTLVFVNVLFMILGASLYMYATAKGIELPAKRDDLFPLLALQYFSPFAGIVFILGIIAATYASTDSALTALTTSFCIDFMNFSKRSDEAVKEKTRLKTHIGFSILLLLIVLLFKAYNDDSIISAIFKIAGYTYGPLLGLYAFSLFTSRGVKDKFVPIVCVLSPLFCWQLNVNSEAWLNGYKFGFELLIINGLITFLGLLAISTKRALNTP
jgi:Na+/proline symporter